MAKVNSSEILTLSKVAQLPCIRRCTISTPIPEGQKIQRPHGPGGTGALHTIENDLWGFGLFQVGSEESHHAGASESRVSKLELNI